MTTIMGVNGLPRRGKTLLLTFWALLIASSGKKVYSNFRISHSNIIQIEPYDLIEFMQLGRKNPCNSPLFNAAFVGTEIYGWLEARGSGSGGVGTTLSYFLFQSGKLGFDILYDAQLNGSVDLRLRELSEFRYEANKNVEESCFEYYPLDVKQPTENIRLEDEEPLIIPFELASKFWNLYSTHEITEPIGYENTLVEMQKLCPEKMNQTVERQVALIIKEGSRYGIKSVRDAQKISVEDCLLQLGEPVCFSAYVANRLKLRMR